MTTKNLSQFASEHWDTYLKSITEISKNNDGKSLVESDVQLYNFDLICQDLFQENPPSSADAIKFKKTILN